jgi:hypothetical protein
MLTEDQKKRIQLYSPKERNEIKAKLRRADEAEVARGCADELQERNRLLPPAVQCRFSDREENLPTE